MICHGVASPEFAHFHKCHRDSQMRGAEATSGAHTQDYPCPNNKKFRVACVDRNNTSDTAIFAFQEAVAM